MIQFLLLVIVIILGLFIYVMRDFAQDYCKLKLQYDALIEQYNVLVDRQITEITNRVANQCLSEREDLEARYKEMNLPPHSLRN